MLSRPRLTGSTRFDEHWQCEERSRILYSQGNALEDCQREKIDLRAVELCEDLARKPNLLINEKSPHLQEHAFTPIEWRPWGDEALQRSKNDRKQIFLSIGYFTCHWCHQLTRESSEDKATAELTKEVWRTLLPNKVVLSADSETYGQLSGMTSCW